MIREDKSWNGRDEEPLELAELTRSIIRNRGVVITNRYNPGREAAQYEFSEEETHWRKSALCRGLDGNMFFPERGHSMLPAYAVCRGCSVRMECLESAIVSGDKWGIRGGFTPEERMKIRRRVVMEKVSYKVASEPFDERRYKRLLKALTRIGLNGGRASKQVPA